MNTEAKTEAPDTRPIVGYFEMSSCDGCGMVVANLGATLIPVSQLVNIAEFRLASSKQWSERFHIVLVEGAITTEEEVHELRQLRARSDYMVAVGACAVTGGIPMMAPNAEILLAQEGVYGAHIKAQGPIARHKLADIVHVDANIYGCPIDGKDLVATLTALLRGGRPDSHDEPVCTECVLAEQGCLIKEQRICLGPITRRGCDAVCVKGGNTCWGCRGLVPDAPLSALEHIITTESCQGGAPKFWRMLEMANKKTADDLRSKGA